MVDAVVVVWSSDIWEPLGTTFPFPSLFSYTTSNLLFSFLGDVVPSRVTLVIEVRASSSSIPSYAGLRLYTWLLLLECE